MLLRNHVAICLLLLCALGSVAQPLPFDPEVKTGKLSNGFTYYIRQNNEPKDRVIMYLVNKVGSILEDEDQRGLAHFMEHMSFNGTKNYPKNQLVDYLQKSGVRFGADINAYTAFDETVYQLPLPSDDTSVVRHGLQIMRDWAADATLDLDEIEKERGVVLEEKRLRNSAQQRFMDKHFPLQVNNSRYAHRLPIGTDEVIKGFKPETIKRFYKDWYRPNLQALIVVGNINVNDIEKQIKKLFGDLKNPAKPKERKKYSIPLTNKNQFIALTDAEQTSTSLDIIIKQPELRYKTAEDYRNAVVRSIANGALAQRLQELSQKPDAPFVNARGGINGFMGGLDAFSMSIVSKPGKVKESFSSVWSLVEQYKRFGITPSELERQKIAYTNRMESILKERDKRPSNGFVDEYLQHFLKGDAVPGIDEENALLKKHLQSITIDDVNKAVRAAIKDVNRDIIILAPEKEKNNLPGAAVVNNWISEVSKSEMVAYTDNFKDEKLFPSLPPKGKIVSRKYIDSINVTVLKLSNGASVYVKPTDFKNDQIIFSSFSEGGSSLVPDSEFRSASVAATLVGIGGVKTFSRQDLQKMLVGKKVNVQPFLAERYEGVSGAAAPKDIETALQLLYLQFTSPRIDTPFITSVIERSKAALANRDSDPAVVFGDTVNSVLSQYHFRRKPETAQSYDEIQIGQMSDIYKERFANPGDFTYVFVGNIDTAVLYDMIEQYIASLPSKGSDEKAKDLGIHIPKGKIERTVYKGNDDKATVRLVFSGEYTFNNENNTQLSALGSVLQYRITERIRETEGGAYTPQAGVNYNKYPRNRYAFNVTFTCAPQNVEKLIAATNEEIEKLKKDGPPKDDIEKFIAEQKRGTELNLRSNDFWLGYLNFVLQNDEPATSVLYSEQHLKEVTPLSVKQAAATYLKGDNYIRLVHMPEKN